MTLFVTYCAICWMVAGLFQLWIFRDPEQRSQLEVVEPALHAKGYRWRHVVLLVTFLAPLWIPAVVASIAFGLAPLLRTQWKIRRAKRSFHEYRFTGINYFEQSPALRAAFDDVTDHAMQTPFRLAGDYQLKTDPVTVLDRFFWHPDGTTWCSCCWVAELSDPGDRNVTFDTLLSDGTHVATAVVENADPDEPPCPDRDRIQVEYLPGASFDEAFQQHVERVRTLAHQRHASVLRFETGQLQTLVVYTQRLFHQYLHRIGESGAPPEPELPPAASRLSPDEYTLGALNQEPSTANAGPQVRCDCASTAGTAPSEG
jgi:hypothetical protein